MLCEVLVPRDGEEQFGQAMRVVRVPIQSPSVRTRAKPDQTHLVHHFEELDEIIPIDPPCVHDQDRAPFGLSMLDEGSLFCELGRLDVCESRDAEERGHNQPEHHGTR